MVACGSACAPSEPHTPCMTRCDAIIRNLSHSRLLASTVRTPECLLPTSTALCSPTACTPHFRSRRLCRRRRRQRKWPPLVFRRNVRRVPLETPHILRPSAGAPPDNPHDIAANRTAHNAREPAVPPTLDDSSPSSIQPCEASGQRRWPAPRKEYHQRRRGAPRPRSVPARRCEAQRRRDLRLLQILLVLLRPRSSRIGNELTTNTRLHDYNRRTDGQNTNGAIYCGASD